MKKHELEAAQTAVDAAQVETSNAWQEAMEETAYYLSVGVEGCTPHEAVVRIKEAFLDFVRPAIERAEAAEDELRKLREQDGVEEMNITLSDALSLANGAKNAIAEGREMPMMGQAAARLADELRKLQAENARLAAVIEAAQALADEVARLNELLNRPIRVCEACAIYPCKCE